MIREFGDNVILALGQDELVAEIGNMELLLEHLLRLNPQMPEEGKEELKHTFEVATTAMKMIWLNYEKDDTRYEKWIQCGERLPEEGEEVLVLSSFRDNKVSIGRRVPEKKYWEWLYWPADWILRSPTSVTTICPGDEYIKAWLPLPGKGELCMADAGSAEGN